MIAIDARFFGLDVSLPTIEGEIKIYKIKTVAKLAPVNLYKIIDFDGAEWLLKEYELINGLSYTVSCWDRGIYAYGLHTKLKISLIYRLVLWWRKERYKRPN